LNVLLIVTRVSDCLLNMEI